MVNKYLSLSLNKRLSSLKFLSDAYTLLDEYNKKNGMTDIHFRLHDRYETLCNIAEVLDSTYTDFELIQIGNLIYNLKGSVESILKFCKFFNLEIKEMTLDYSTVLRIRTNCNTVDLARFEIYLNKLCNELLISDSTIIAFDDVSFEANINNNVTGSISTKLVNYIKIKAI